MARRIDFNQDDLQIIQPLYAALNSEPTRWQQITGRRRWLRLEPAAGKPAFTLYATKGLDEGVELYAHPLGVEPGKPIAPTLAQRGVRTPSGWQIATDVGWVLKWRAPSATGYDELLGFGFKVAEALDGAPEDRRWRASLHSSDPRPGRAGAKI